MCIILAQYTHTWTCHLHEVFSFTTNTNTDITPHHPPRPWPKLHPLSPTPSTPPQPKHGYRFHTLPVPIGLVKPKPNPLSQSSHPLTTRPEPNTYTFHTLHLHLSSHGPHSTLTSSILYTTPEPGVSPYTHTLYSP